LVIATYYGQPHRIGIALGVRSSMQGTYAARHLLVKATSGLLQEYAAQDWIEKQQADRQPIHIFQREA